MNNDEEGWGQLATIILAGAGVVAIITDLLLIKFIKKYTALLTTNLFIIMAGYLFFINKKDRLSATFPLVLIVSIG